jgi:predicted metal-dependent phosphoesterase TrpH
MLKFMRKKTVSVEPNDNNAVFVHGILDDDIYSLELELEIELEGMTISDLKGRWNRRTTAECPRALLFLGEAIGFKVTEEGFPEKVHRVVGRKACRHFANLLLECCEAGCEAALILRWEESRKAGGSTKIKDFLLAGEPRQEDSAPVISDASASPSEPPSVLPKEGEPFLIDLHIHTHPASPCSSIRIEEAARRAKEVGLSAFCLTDHNHLWAKDLVEDLGKRHGILILRGNEITTDQGDILVFGLEKDIKGIIRIEELRDLVMGAGGAMIAAHPFRGFLTFGVGRLGLTPQRAMERPVFRYVDGLEVLNGKVTVKENLFAAEVASLLGKTSTGGSDAHEAQEIGLYATAFKEAVRDERDLIEAVRTGACTAVDLTKRS